MKKIFLFLILTISYHGVLPTNLHAQDFMGLSLQELMEIKISRTVPFEIHHVHPGGELMLSYNAMSMMMEGNRRGTNEVSNQYVLQDYMVAPIRMKTRTHMLGAMYAPNDSLTMMAMLPYKEMSMDHITQTGTTFTTESAGMGDLKISSLWTVNKTSHQVLFITLGLGLPTGAINQKDDLPTGTNLQLPYPMQLGSGTVDPTFGLTFTTVSEDNIVGVHIDGTFRLGKNYNDYQLGNLFRSTIWHSHIWTDIISTFVRLDSLAWGDIDGHDASLNLSSVPTADPNLRNGQRVDLGIGINLQTPGRKQFSVQSTLPVYQDLNGPQLEKDYGINLRFSQTF